MKTGRDRASSTAPVRGLVGLVAAALLVSTLTLLTTEASALDINGLAALAMSYARYHGGFSAHRSAAHTAAKRDRNSDDADDEDSSGSNAKSAGTTSSQHHQPVRRSVEASAATSPADDMVSLARPHDDEAALRPAR